MAGADNAGLPASFRNHPMKPVLLLLAAAASLATLAHAQTPAEAPRSLNQARSEVNHGTSPGIVIFKSKAKADGSASAASAASAAAVGAQAPAPVGNRIVERLNLGEPPSGRPLTGAKRLNAPDQGIPLPTAATAAAAASAAKR